MHRENPSLNRGHIHSPIRASISIKKKVTDLTWGRAAKKTKKKKQGRWPCSPAQTARLPPSPSPRRAGTEAEADPTRDQAPSGFVAPKIEEGSSQSRSPLLALSFFFVGLGQRSMATSPARQAQPTRTPQKGLVVRACHAEAELFDAAACSLTLAHNQNRSFVRSDGS